MTESPRRSGYGNIYTPHAGSMIITVQRESGLANRTITLTQRQVRLLRVGLYVVSALAIIIGGSWFFLATQAARVPSLTKRISTLQQDVQRVDTLRQALADMEHRFQQVQRMLGATDTPPPEAPRAAATRSTASGTVADPAPAAGTSSKPTSPAPVPSSDSTHAPATADTSSVPY
ncbi:MAG TPA: hypothetical protein VFK13_03630 [Gemmatimonadaceae bacterium]|nr:hypothetical protein [Gemmatimonadaceae bacterium]